MNIKIIWIFGFIFLFSSHAAQSTQVYANGTTGSYVVSLNEGNLEIYTITDAGTLHLFQTIEGSFVIAELYGTSNWTIDRFYDISFSPNNQYVAFTASRNTNEFALFLYDFSTGNLRQESISTLMNVVWSPDSDTFVLSPIGHAGMVLPAPEATIYDIRSGQLTAIDGDPSTIETNFRWFSDNQIVYEGEAIPCSDACNARRDLYITDVLGGDSSPITNLGSSLSADIFHNICDPTISSFNHHIYYIVGCSEYAAREIQYLYSVDASGNNRLELSPADLYPGGDIYEIRGIHINSTTGNVYVSLYIQDSSNSYWKSLRITPSQQVSVVYETTFTDRNATFLQVSSLSPNENYIALAGFDHFETIGGIFTVVNIQTGQPVISNTELALTCEMQWLDNQYIAYTQTNNAGCGGAGMRDGTFLIDLNGSSPINLTQDLNQPSWLISVADS